MNATSNLSDVKILEQLNDAEIKARLPAIIFQSILIVVGVAGNTCVWYIYGYKFRKRSTHKSLVLGIAFYDSLACCIGMPGNIVDLRNPLMFYNSTGCKILRFGYHVLAAGSTSTHLLMGIDRYRRICVLHGVQMSHKFVVYMLVLTFILATIISSPTLVFYESIEIPTSVSGVSGKQCSQSESTKESILLLLYEVLLGVLVLAIITCLIVFYSLIGRKICNRENVIISGTNNSVRSIEPHNSEPNTAEEVNEAKSHREKGKAIDKKLYKTHTNEGRAQHWSSRRQSNESDVVNMVKEMQIRRASLRNSKSRKLTLITFLLMLIFITSYCPVIILTAMYSTNRELIDDLSFSEKCAYFVFLVSYTINNVSNPLVYLAIDDEFREKFLQIFSVCCK